jgi:hypothetical protein
MRTNSGPSAVSVVGEFGEPAASSPLVRAEVFHVELLPG